MSLVGDGAGPCPAQPGRGGDGADATGPRLKTTCAAGRSCAVLRNLGAAATGRMRQARGSRRPAQLAGPAQPGRGGDEADATGPRLKTTCAAGRSCATWARRRRGGCDGPAAQDDLRSWPVLRNLGAAATRRMRRARGSRRPAQLAGPARSCATWARRRRGGCDRPAAQDDLRSWPILRNLGAAATRRMRRARGSRRPAQLADPAQPGRGGDGADATGPRLKTTCAAGRSCATWARRRRGGCDGPAAQDDLRSWPEEIPPRPFPHRNHIEDKHLSV